MSDEMDEALRAMLDAEREKRGIVPIRQFAMPVQPADYAAGHQLTKDEAKKRKKADRVSCPECGRMALTYFSIAQGCICIKGHCRPGTDPKKSIGCDCPGSYKPAVAKTITEDEAMDELHGPMCETDR